MNQEQQECLRGQESGKERGKGSKTNKIAQIWFVECHVLFDCVILSTLSGWRRAKQVEEKEGKGNEISYLRLAG